MLSMRSNGLGLLLTVTSVVACGGGDDGNAAAMQTPAGGAGAPSTMVPTSTTPAATTDTTGMPTMGAAGGGSVAGTGTLQIEIEPEGDVLAGLIAGTGEDDIQDGWAVTFTKLVATLGDVEATLPADGMVGTVVSDDEEVFAVDVLNPASQMGVQLWSLPNLPTDPLDFIFQSRGANGATAHSSVDMTDFNEMAAGDWTYLIEGTLNLATGQSCPPAALAMPGAAVAAGTNAGGDSCYPNPAINFRIGASSEFQFLACQLDGARGFMVPAGGAQTVSITIHGDHLFLNGFSPTPMLLAQWLADSDLNLDGMVTNAELMQIAPAMLSAIDSRFVLTADFVTAPFANMMEYIGALLRTFPEYNGDGECVIAQIDEEEDAVMP